MMQVHSVLSTNTGPTGPTCCITTSKLTTIQKHGQLLIKKLFINNDYNKQSDPQQSIDFIRQQKILHCLFKICPKNIICLRLMQKQIQVYHRHTSVHHRYMKVCYRYMQIYQFHKWVSQSHTTFECVPQRHFSVHQGQQVHHRHVYVYYILHMQVCYGNIQVNHRHTQFTLDT